MSFDTLGLCAELLKAVHDEGYTEPTPVQSQAIPAILNGQDLMVSAQTGTGKTAGFTLPLLHRLHHHESGPKQKNHNSLPIRALILTPTRELAAQVVNSVQTYSKYLPMKSMAVFGGVKISPQMVKLRRGTDILVATPGRLLDLINQNCVHLSRVEIFILDEADRMLDMGFIHDIRRVIQLLPKQRQNLLFSATLSKEVRELANKFMHSPKFIEIAPQHSTAERVTQIVHPVDRQRKRDLLSFMIGSQNWRQVLVFTRTKHGANRLSEQLNEDGLSSLAIHGNKTQGARTRALDDFKRGKVRVLVATDVAARGLDIDKLPHVVNFDLPNTPEDYVHRIGRTGRANQDGAAVSLVCIDEWGLLKNIEKLLRCKIPQAVIPGYEPNPSIKAEPISMGGNRRPQQRRRPGSGGGRSSTPSHSRRPQRQRGRREH